MLAFWMCAIIHIFGIDDQSKALHMLGLRKFYPAETHYYTINTILVVLSVSAMHARLLVPWRSEEADGFPWNWV